MWQKSYQKLYQNVKKEAIWRTWTDVNNWTAWQDDIDSCTMDGKFEVGNHFMFKPKGASPVKITLTKVEPNSTFTDCTKFFGAKMYDTHTVEETEKGLLLNNTITVTGPLRWLWVKLVAQDVANTAPQAMDALVELARKSEA